MPETSVTSATPKSGFAPFVLVTREVNEVVRTPEQWEQIQTDFTNTHRDNGRALGLARRLGTSEETLPLFSIVYRDGHQSQTLQAYLEQQTAIAL